MIHPRKHWVNARGEKWIYLRLILDKTRAGSASFWCFYIELILLDQFLVHWIYWFEIGKVLTGKLLFEYYSMIGTILNPLIHGFSSDLMNIYQCWGRWYGTKAIDSNRFWWYLLYGLHRLSTVFSKHLRNALFWFFQRILPENKLITRT